MRYIVFFVLGLSSWLAFANPAFEDKASEYNLQKSDQEKAAEAVIDKLILAYNKQNIRQFLALYDDDVEFYMYPQTLMFKGKKQLIKRYGLMFEKMQCLKSTSIKRITNGNIVIDHETSEICTQKPDVVDKRSEFVTSYQIEEGKIKKVVFFR
ncbi:MULTISPECIES: nuclear transport factor 2 family protein [Pseudoalteromonas]|uniref:Nuclear transport factor 2 family protein n=1 Tax=Pseudoalteromonas obscura TaxID=3048491 RepID=A0ABT7EM74_9GAMM|nr:MULTISPECIES: nuclear transport factor 2 family protein [Pseudoalteromonas]MBQ4837898.1 nuclear transport factor 2 family protein [Pseudoalteromonas luteoviolacea]MDK2596156.1 nuclear transport factor 2 family protein [Pseudoalteromonas sp. P94(2023)]